MAARHDRGALPHTSARHLKGLSRTVVLRRPCAKGAADIGHRNSDDYMRGGLLVTGTRFKYRGLGLLIATGAEERDIPMLMAGCCRRRVAR